jgi:hypothetical protein
MEGVAWSAQRIPTAVNLGFLDGSRYFSIQVAPQLSSRCSVDPVPDPLLLRKSGSAWNLTRDLWICSQELWPLDHRGGSREGTRILKPALRRQISKELDRKQPVYFLLFYSQHKVHEINAQSRGRLCPFAHVSSPKLLQEFLINTVMSLWLRDQ